MSLSQFHCTSRLYLDMHGLIFETSICYWQDQPGRPPSTAVRGASRSPGTSFAGRGQAPETGGSPAPGVPAARAATAALVSLPRSRVEGVLPRVREPGPVSQLFVRVARRGTCDTRRVRETSFRRRTPGPCGTDLLATGGEADRQGAWRLSVVGLLG